jgi:hypothetical protein
MVCQEKNVILEIIFINDFKFSRCWSLPMTEATLPEPFDNQSKRGETFY